MKKILFLFTILVSIGCANIYSPTGIKGSDAIKEIEEAQSSAGFLAFPILLSGISSTSTSTSSNVTCTADANAISPLATTTSTANFTTPGINEATVDLTTTASGGYFRSQAISDTVTFSSPISAKIITGTASCRYSIGTGFCGTTNLTSVSAGTTISSSFAGSITSTSSNSCLAIYCNGAATVRLKRQSTSTTSSGSTFNFTGLILGPEIFKSVAGIDESKYYKKESVEECKNSIVSISVLSSALLSARINQFSTDSTAAQACNSNSPSFADINLPAFSTEILQGESCKLEEVGFLGVI
ncbi:TIGR04452 family lipoprotein [Leptospira sp. GIMC2001]|uniref:TIGR04452 family lipoprotein n=1 Tax=Leptospira sp. GIMC2001 TaxID=1513297 RepID=UPI00234B97BB|nr:TIGR04452 family lipoprotein [Leptospira sp. GIMC2001]WCL48793.1 TIGR04452 family lipoprotein [Leptospira sp. GIMC2001]